ncbi:MAG: hypothetical protein EXR69_13485, partial [Myxococcales bacterium]|nr:hypothetical protein [Myxococcales bacterium]
MPERCWHIQPFDGTTEGAARQAITSIRVPGDKSISHRALLLNRLAPSGPISLGEGHPSTQGARMRGLLESEDVLRTQRACEQMTGARPSVEVSQLHPRIDCGNSGTTARLLLGALAGWSDRSVGAFILHGDASLSRRPMRRVLAPLSAMGAVFDPPEAATLPLAVRPSRLRGIEWEATMASAQVKSAVLLAG